MHGTHKLLFPSWIHGVTVARGTVSISWAGFASANENNDNHFSDANFSQGSKNKNPSNQ